MSLEKNKREDAFEFLIRYQEIRIAKIEQQATEKSIAGLPLQNDADCGIIQLDENGRIISYTIITDQVHHYFRKKKGLLFTKMLDPRDHARWHYIASRQQRFASARTVATLHFCHNRSDAFAAFCIITWKASTHQYRFWFLSERKDKMRHAKPERPFSMPMRDYETITAIHDFLLENLTESLPKQPQLARSFGINQQKLKSGFRQLYHNSVHRFVIDKRLELSWDLLTGTDLPLEVVAEKCGYKTYHNFSIRFRNKYSFPPVSLRHSIPQSD